MIRARITGVGRYVPPRVVTNHDLKQWMDTSDEWIRERSGIVERHWVDEKTATSDLAVEASKIALEQAGKKPEEVDFIIFATLSSDYYFPGSGVLLQHKLDMPKVGAMDVRNQCSGFVYSLATAKAFIQAEMYKTILVVGAEVHSKGLDISTEGRDVAVLFGDGAGAVVVEGFDDNSDRGILTTHLHSQGKYAEYLWTEAPGSAGPRHISHEILEAGKAAPKMKGRDVFKHAIVRFPEVIMEALNTIGATLDDVDLLIPHQANLRISEAVRQRLGLPPEKVYNNIERYGNTTAATIPIALSEVLEKGMLKEGDLLILAAFGSGFTWASAAIRW